METHRTDDTHAHSPWAMNAHRIAHRSPTPLANFSCWMVLLSRCAVCMTYTVCASTGHRLRYSSSLTHTSTTHHHTTTAKQWRCWGSGARSSPSPGSTGPRRKVRSIHRLLSLLADSLRRRLSTVAVAVDRHTITHTRTDTRTGALRRKGYRRAGDLLLRAPEEEEGSGDGEPVAPEALSTRGASSVVVGGLGF